MVDVVVVARRVMTAASDDGNAAHIQQPTVGVINQKGGSLSQKFSGGDFCDVCSQHHGRAASEAPVVFDATPRDLPADALARRAFRFATRRAD